MGKEKCKRPKPAVVQKETGSQPKCKNEPVEPVVDPVEETEPEYELFFKVTEASSGRPMNNLRVRVIISKDRFGVIHTDPDGVYQRRAGANGHTCQLEFPNLDPIYKLKVANPTATTQPKGGSATVIEVERRLLEIVSVDPHFVPTGKDDDENLQIRYHIHGIKSAEDPDPKVYVAIRNNASWLYHQQLTAAEVADGGNKLLKWDGKINAPDSGNLLNKVATPLLGPFKVLLMYNSPTGRLATDYETFNILYHSIKISPGSYLEDPGSPPARLYPVPQVGHAQWNDHIKWIQFRLNQQGYFAGIVDGNLNEQTKRAVKRFTYEMINYNEADFSNNNEDLRKTAFLNALAGDTLKVNLFEKEAVITDKGTESKIYIQNNYYYHSDGQFGITNFNVIDGHWQKENEGNNCKLDRFEYPLCAEVKLLSRTNKEVISADAVWDLKIKWTVSAPDEDFSNIPAYNEATAPSNARTYIKKVHSNVKALPGALGGNCPAACGGVGNGHPYFVKVLDPCVVTTGASNLTSFSSFCTDATKSKLHGKSMVLFKGSNIGGDKFVISAAISFDNLANEAALIAAHASRPADDMKASTGKMTIWRQRRVVAVIDWMEEKATAVEWDEVKAAFKAAYIELDTSDVTHQLMKEIIEPGDKAFYLDFVQEEMHLDANVRATLQFPENDMHPFPIPKFKRAKGQTDEQLYAVIKNSFENFAGALTRLTTGNNNRKTGEWLGKIISRRKRPGLKIWRCIPFKGFDYKENILKKPVKNLGRNEGRSCTGIGGGVAFICEDYRKKLKDGFLLSHEMGHCLYLQHPFDGAGAPLPIKNRAYEHDMGDKNCMMWYLHSESAKGVAHNKRPMGRDTVPLQPGSPNKPLFCGKCLLKLRGWKVNGNDAAIAAILPHDSSTIPLPTPCNARMRFDGYFINEGYYTGFVNGKAEPERIRLTVDAKDPSNPAISLGPQSFLHKHTLTWESSDGDMESLSIYKTRERIVFNQPSQADPFNEAADPEQDYAQEGEDGDKGWGIDRHSIRWPALICKPGSTGKITGSQVYQYIAKDAPKGTQWTDIPESNFILEKEVYIQDGHQCIKFRKANGPGNPNNFEFVVCYKVGQVPASPPYIKDYHLSVDDHGKLAGDGRKFVLTPEAIIWKNGKKTCECKGDSIEGRPTSLEELEQLGYLAPKPWP